MRSQQVHCPRGMLVILSVIVLCSSGMCGIRTAVASDQTVAVWYGEILDYGIVSTGTADDTLRPMVLLYGEAGDTVAVDSIRAGTAVKYERMSELRRLSPGRLLSDQALRGEWFKVQLGDVSGWLRGNNLMTVFGVDWGRRLEDRFRSIPGPKFLALLVSGQYWTTHTVAATLWTRDREREEWILVDVLMHAIDGGLYTTPRIDSIDFSPSETIVYAGSLGADGGDSWGEKVVLKISGDSLTILSREPFVESHEGP